jgi:hypothetical protein
MLGVYAEPVTAQLMMALGDRFMCSHPGPVWSARPVLPLRDQP